MRFSLVLPCYNEREHIEVSLQKIRTSLDFSLGNENYEILLVDDGSEDGTREHLKSISNEKNIKVFFHPENRGRGAAVKQGLKLAQGNSTGFIDIDCEVSEVYIPKCLQIVEEGSDLVIGARTYSVSFSPRGIMRYLSHEGYKKVVKHALKTKVSDSETGYKFFSQRAKEKILSESRFDNWFFDTEVIQICESGGLKIEEVPVLFVRNSKKTSTVRVIPDSLNYLKSLYRFKRQIP